MLLAEGARSYTAFDRFRLIGQTPVRFYEILLEELKKLPFFERAQNAIKGIGGGKFRENIMYIVDPRYCITDLPGGYDLVISQAVMEHLDTPARVIIELYARMRENGIIFGEVDAGTHTGILRDIDPLNLYRYPDVLWNILKFKGSPNRILPSTYQRMLINAGFKNVKIDSIRVYDEEYVKKSKKHLFGKYKNCSAEDIGVKSFF